ncbi:hypothetical protein OAN13_02345 [Opitutales bacterium]|nr:hypothetical protein [Opitutales bacterium]
MKYAKIGSLIMISLVVGSLLAWVIRGAYDQHFMMEGYFHVVSNAKQDHEIGLKFPSGKQMDFTLKKGSSVDFKLSNTGEGSITVAIDGTVRDQVGYVTSMNSIVVLVIGDEETEFSQIFPSLITEQGSAADAAKPRR